MSDTFTLEEESVQPLAAEPAQKPWSPAGGGASFASALTVIDKPTPKRSRKKKSPKNRNEPIDPLSVPVKLLPEPKPEKLSKSAQRKRENARLVKVKHADDDALRLIGSDDKTVEIPKKRWLTTFTGKRARPDEVAETLTDLASMLESGQSEKDSVEALATQYANYDIGQAYERVVLLMERGVSLSVALADQTDALPPVVRELIAAVKMPTDMHRNLRQAAIIILEADTIKAQIKSALFKPGFLAAFLGIFVFISIQFLLPMTTDMFTGIGAEVPPMTKVILGFADGLKIVLIVLFALVVLWNIFWKLFGKNIEAIAVLTDNLALKLPLIGEISRMAVAARFCDVLAACLAVAMSEVEALETAGRACGNRALAAWVSEHVGRQRRGLVTFSDVAKTEMLPWNFRNRIETTTSLEARTGILRELAASFHFKAQARLNRFADRIGPISEAVVIVITIIVALIIMSPILSYLPTMLDTIS